LQVALKMGAGESRTVSKSFKLNNLYARF